MQMKQKFKRFLQFGIFLFGIAFMIYSCQKDDDFSKPKIEEEASVYESKFKTIYHNQIPKSITNYLKDKTGNTLHFLFLENEIKPITSQTFASRGADLEIGTVDTSKSVMVVNPTNTKYTFEMVNSDVTSKHNLVVIDFGTELVNYYISYKPEPNWTDIYSMPKDMKFYTGDIIFYNTNGVESSVLQLANGIIAPNTSNIINDPCDEVVDDTTDDNTDDTNDNSNGSGGSPSDTSNGTGNTGGGTGSSSGGGGDTYIADAEVDYCNYTLSQECTGGGHHTSPANCTVGDGWSVDITVECGTLVNLRTSVDPCVGDVGVLIDPEIFENNCEELNKLTSNPPVNTTNPYTVDGSAADPTGNNTSTRIAIINSSTNSNFEHGFGFYNAGNYPVYGSYAHYIAPSDGNHVHLPTIGFQFGTLHTPK